MSVVERLGDLQRQGNAHWEGKPLRGQRCYKGVQPLTRYMFHDDVGSARNRILIRVVNPDNSGVRQPACSLGFAEKSRPVSICFADAAARNGDDFDCNDAMNPGIVRLINHTHRAPTKLSNNLISAKALRFQWPGHTLVSPIRISEIAITEQLPFFS